jgi:hypothetical protein
MSEREWYNCPPTDLRGYHPTKRSERCEVTYSVSQRYKGGRVIEGKWYDGFKVPAPLMNPDCAIISIAVGLQLNARPPYATCLMVPKAELREDENYMDCDGVWKRHDGPLKEIEVQNGIRRPTGELVDQ